jgi:ABC-type transport system involved in multi-copper enzyme maturation permease subunit
MFRLLSIEFFKLKNTRYFWILAVLFVVFLFALPIGAHFFQDYLGSKGEVPVLGITANEIPLFDFVDIWQNLTFLYKYFSIFLGFIIVISVCNEFSYGTIKQNVIDGLSREELWLSKVLFIIAISLVMSLVALFVGLMCGLMWSPVTEWNFIVKNIAFIPAYFLHLVGFQLLCMVISLLIKRSGIVIALMVFYIYIIENIATGIIEYHYKLPWLADLFPVQAIGNIIRSPFNKFLLQETQDFVAMGDLGILAGYIALLLFLAYWLVGKRDLN